MQTKLPSSSWLRHCTRAAQQTLAAATPWDTLPRMPQALWSPGPLTGALLGMRTLSFRLPTAASATRMCTRSATSGATPSSAVCPGGSAVLACMHQACACAHDAAGRLWSSSLLLPMLALENVCTCGVTGAALCLSCVSSWACMGQSQGCCPDLRHPQMCETPVCDFGSCHMSQAGMRSWAV